MKKSLLVLSLLVVVGMLSGIALYLLYPSFIGAKRNRDHLSDVTQGRGLTHLAVDHNGATAPQIIPANNYSIDASSTSLVIMNNNVVSQTITLKDIPSFDTDWWGYAAVPETDYTFDTEATLLDGAHSKVYFSVVNSRYGGSNASRTIFSYNILDKKLDLLKKSFGTSFAPLHLSEEANYLAFTSGDHGGMCSNTIGFWVYDLKNNKDLGAYVLKTSLGTSTTGYVEFDHWINNSSFVYKEGAYKNDKECQTNPNGIKVTYKTYQINSASLFVDPASSTSSQL